MTTLAVLGAGPAGLATVERIVADQPVAEIVWLDRRPRPDGPISYGLSVGIDRLRALAGRIDAVVTQPQVHFHGGVDVGSDAALWSALRQTCDGLILATGAATDLPLEVPGGDCVGVTTVSHLQAWQAGSPDAAPDELDMTSDSAVVLGEAPSSQEVGRLLATRLRSVTSTPASVVGIVGRRRARAVRILGARDADGMVRVRDVRAQVVVRAVGEAQLLPGLPGDPATAGTTYLTDGGRLVGVPGGYAVGWAARRPSSERSHREDVEEVLAALATDLDVARPQGPEARAALCSHLRRAGAGGLPAGWSARAHVEEWHASLRRDDGVPTADYDDLLAQVDDD